MIDYGVVKNDDSKKRWLRKKTLSVMRYTPWLVAWTAVLIDTPTSNCVFPLVVA